MASEAVVTLIPKSYYKSKINPSATSSITLLNTGMLTGISASGGSYAWLTGGDPTLYEVLATMRYGTLTTGTTGSWLALSSDRSWSVVETSNPGTVAAGITLSIRLIGTTTILASANIDLAAEVTGTGGTL